MDRGKDRLPRQIEMSAKTIVQASMEMQYLTTGEGSGLTKEGGER